MKKWWRSIFQITFVVICAVIFAGCDLLDKKKAGLLVITNEVSSIFLDGKYLDKTLADNNQYIYSNKELKPGDYTLEIRPDNQTFVAHNTKISLKKGVQTVLSWKPGTRAETSGGALYEMEKLRDSKKSEVSITTIPDGAIIHFDGVAQGFAPKLIEDLADGEHEYQVELPSYETQKNPIKVLKGYRTNITVKLGKQDFTAIESIPTPEVVASTSAILATPSAAPTSRTAPPSPSPSPRSTPRVSPSPTTTLPRPKVRINATGFMNNGQEVLRVRDSSGPAGKELGYAPVGSEYVYLGTTQNGWHQITFNGLTGWVSGQYSQLFE